MLNKTLGLAVAWLARNAVICRSNEFHALALSCSSTAGSAGRSGPKPASDICAILDPNLCHFLFRDDSAAEETAARTAAVDGQPKDG